MKDTRRLSPTERICSECLENPMAKRRLRVRMQKDFAPFIELGFLPPS